MLFKHQIIPLILNKIKIFPSEDFKTGVMLYGRDKIQESEIIKGEITIMKHLVHITQNEIDVAAENYFRDISGLKINKPDSSRMYEDADAVRDKLREYIKPKALARSFSREALRGNGLHIEGHSFPCHILAGLEKESVLAVYAFVLTVGELPKFDQSIIEALYADLWGTAYINAAGDALRLYLRGQHAEPVYVSAPISPGFYDMDIKKISELFQIVNGNEIGVYEQGFMMNPLKSCAGFYFAAENESRLKFLNERCLYCHRGSGGGCVFCCHRQKT